MDHSDLNNPALIPWYKQFWPWFIMGLPAIVVVACIYTVMLAFQHQDSLVNDNYYKVGKAINQSLGQRNTAKKLAIIAQLNFDFSTQTVTVTTNSSNVDSGDFALSDLVLTLSHPFDSKQDNIIVLSNVAPNVFSGSVPSLSGRWYLKLIGSSDQLTGGWSIDGEIDLNIRRQLQLQP
ncbi:MAG: hypothetical protein ACJAQS_001321 [Porticoccus sp.]